MAGFSGPSALGRGLPTPRRRKAGAARVRRPARRAGAVRGAGRLRTMPRPAGPDPAGDGRAARYRHLLRRRRGSGRRRSGRERPLQAGLQSRAADGRGLHRLPAGHPRRRVRDHRPGIRDAVFQRCVVPVLPRRDYGRHRDRPHSAHPDRIAARAAEGAAQGPRPRARKMVPRGRRAAAHRSGPDAGHAGGAAQLCRSPAGDAGGADGPEPAEGCRRQGRPLGPGRTW